MKILIIKFRLIGDVLLLSPFVNSIKKRYPDSQIDLVINDDCIDMFRYNPKIDNIYPYPRGYIKKLSLFKRAIKEWRYFKSLKRDYDIVFNLTEGDRGAIYSLLLNAPLKIGVENRNTILKHLKLYTYSAPFPDGMHTIEKNLSFLKFANIDTIDKELELYHSKDDDKHIDNILKSYDIKEFVHIHPVSRQLFKCWSVEGFAEVIDYIKSIYKIPVVITSAPNSKELGIINKILTLTKSQAINLSGQLSLSQLSALISRSKLFIGVDTAPMHMASAHNIPIIALFGPTNPLSWGPWDNKIGKSCYKDIYQTTQYCGRNSLIRGKKGEILKSSDGDISSSMMSIEADSVIAEIDRYLGDNR